MTSWKIRWSRRVRGPPLEIWGLNSKLEAVGWGSCILGSSGLGEKRVGALNPCLQLAHSLFLSTPPHPTDPLPPIPLDFPGSFDVLSPSSDSEGLSSVFSSSLPSPDNSSSPSPRGPTDSLDWLEVLSGGPPLGCGPPAPSIFSADLSDSSGTRLWDVLEDRW